jgi:hypothetical protein
MLLVAERAAMQVIVVRKVLFAGELPRTSFYTQWPSPLTPVGREAYWDCELGDCGRDDEYVRVLLSRRAAFLVHLRERPYRFRWSRTTVLMCTFV